MVRIHSKVPSDGNPRFGVIPSLLNFISVVFGILVLIGADLPNVVADLRYRLYT
jgi:hypothetical protein